MLSKLFVYITQRIKDSLTLINFIEGVYDTKDIPLVSVMGRVNALKSIRARRVPRTAIPGISYHRPLRIDTLYRIILFLTTCDRDCPP